MENTLLSPKPHSPAGLLCRTMAALAAWCCLVPLAGAAVPALDVNLLVNPEAEAGNTSGWVTPERQWVVAAEITPHGGSKFFWPGSGDVANTSMYQDVDLSGLSTSIDASTLYLHLSGWLANWDQFPHDRATLSIYALDASRNTLAFRSVEHRSPTWTQYRIDQVVPAGTRTLRVVLTATRFVGIDDDGYFDDLSLVVNDRLGASVAVTNANGQSHVAVGATLPLRATTTGGTDSGFVWSSSFEAVATVDQNGVVTGRSAGRTTVQARGKDTAAIGTYDVSVIGTSGLVFVEPSADKVLVSGTTTSVTWSVVGSVPSAVLNVSKDGGVTYSVVANIANPASGSYAWTVPALTADVRNAVLKLTYSGGEALSPIFSIVAPWTLTAKSDCLFNWAERTYPEIFAPAGAVSANFPPYYYRYYSKTGTYLASSSADSHIWILSPLFGNVLLDVAPVEAYLSVAGCRQ